MPTADGTTTKTIVLEPEGERVTVAVGVPAEYFSESSGMSAVVTATTKTP